MARQKGLEPLTYCLEGSCSIQLSYWRIFGAGDGNRTRVSSLEGWCSTIELHPQLCYEAIQLEDSNITSPVCQVFSFGNDKLLFRILAVKPPGFSRGEAGRPQGLTDVECGQ